MDVKLQELNFGSYVIIYKLCYKLYNYKLCYNIIIMHISSYFLFYSEIVKTMIEQVKEYLNERPREIQETTEDWNDDVWSNR